MASLKVLARIADWHGWPLIVAVDMLAQAIRIAVGWHVPTWSLAVCAVLGAAGWLLAWMRGSMLRWREESNT